MVFSGRSNRQAEPDRTFCVDRVDRLAPLRDRQLARIREGLTDAANGGHRGAPVLRQGAGDFGRAKGFARPAHVDPIKDRGPYLCVAWRHAQKARAPARIA